MSEPTGCIIDEAATHEVVERMYADGMVVSFAGSDSSLVGHAGRQHSRGLGSVRGGNGAEPNGRDRSLAGSVRIAGPEQAGNRRTVARHGGGPRRGRSKEVVRG